MFIKAVLGRVEIMRNGLNYPVDELLVVNYHSTPEKFIHDFELQVVTLKKLFRILDPLELNDYFSGKYRKEGRCFLLFTFDDGLKNNLFAASILEKHGIRAYFFIVPKFIDTPIEEQKNYYVKNIRPIINNHIDNKEEDFTALSWTTIRLLAEKGHKIGSHTFTHTLIAQDSDLSNSDEEIVKSKNYIMEKVGVPIDSFCSINNTLQSIHQKEKKLIADNYLYHFTTLPGLNSEEKNPLFIKRRNIESYWLMGAVFYALGKSDLVRWKNRILEYTNI